MDYNLNDYQKIDLSIAKSQKDSKHLEQSIQLQIQETVKEANAKRNINDVSQQENKQHQDHCEGEPKVEFVYNQSANYSKYYKKFCIFEWPKLAQLYKYSQIRNPIDHHQRSNVSYLKTILEESRKEYGNYMKGVRFRPFLNTSKTQYTIKCYITKEVPYHCPWRLIYHYDQKKSIYLLKSYNTTHEHPVFKNYRMQITREVKKIKQKFNNKNQAYEHIKKLTNNFEDCSKDIKLKSIGTIKQIYRQKKSLQQNLKKCLKQFKKSGNLRKYVLDNQLRKQKMDNHQQIINYNQTHYQKSDRESVIILTNSIMKLLFRAYNRVLFIDREYVFQNDIYEQPKYSLFIFSGIGHSGQSVYFSIGMIREENKQRLQIMLKIFFTTMQELPHTLSIRINDSNLLLVIEQHIAKQYPNIAIFKRQDNSQIYSGLKTANNIVESQISEIEQRANNYQRIKFCKWSLYDLLTSSSRYSYEKYQGNFVGFKLPTGRVFNRFRELEKLKKRYEELPNIICFRVILRKVINVVIKENKNYSEQKICKLQMQHFYSNVKNIQKIRHVLEAKPFNKFITNLSQARQLSIIFSYSPHFYVVQDQYMPYIVSSSQNMRPLYTCECRYYQKSGLPCKHIIKIALANTDNLLNCIDLYWIVNFAIIGLDIISRCRNTQRSYKNNQGIKNNQKANYHGYLLHSKKIQENLCCFQSKNQYMF